jgi:signal transduction histidine kinase
VKTGLWLSRRHVRWTIVLLALMPMVPTALMVNMMLESAQQDRNLAISEIVDVYRDQLALILNRFGSTTDQSSLQKDLLRIYGDEVAIEIRTPEGKLNFQTGSPMTETAISVEMRKGIYKDWKVSIDGVATVPPMIDEATREVWKQAFWIISGVMLAAATVWFVVHRGLRVDELRSDMVTTVSHEMKTPIASMKVLLETLTDSDFLDDRGRREYLELLSLENERLGRLAANFLTFSRLEKGEMQMNPAPLALANFISEMIRPGGDVRVDIPPGLKIRADHDALSMLIGNLIENGLKYGGEPPVVKITTEADGPNLRITVSDNGSGIPKKERRDVFRRYFQGDHLLHHKRKGVGLGLAICKRLAKLMHGKIRIENSETNSGARFVLILKNVVITPTGGTAHE